MIVKNSDRKSVSVLICNRSQSSSN